MDADEKARGYAEQDASAYLPQPGGGMYGARQDRNLRARLEAGAADPAFQTARNLGRRTTDDSWVMDEGGRPLERGRTASIYGQLADALWDVIRRRAAAEWEGPESLNDMGHFKRLEEARAAGMDPTAARDWSLGVARSPRTVTRDDLEAAMAEDVFKRKRR